MTYQWTVYATMTALVLAVTGLLGTARFQLLGRFDRIAERIDQRFDKIDQRFDRMDDQRRAGKAEILDRLDVLAERITRLEAG